MANQSENLCCEWTRLPDVADPRELRLIQFHIGCEGAVATGSIPVYPDVCPHCGRAVEVKS